MTPNLTASRNAYRENAVLAASPGQLIVMLYDGARRFLTHASAAMQAGDIELTHRQLRRAEAIISHLQGTLDHEQGGDIADRLLQIYVFCRRRLNEARVDRDYKKVDDVCRLLGSLRDAWATVAEQ
jgi:flagellar protein FliS